MKTEGTIFMDMAQLLFLLPLESTNYRYPVGDRWELGTIDLSDLTQNCNILRSLQAPLTDTDFELIQAAN